ncbi:hypothetical protein GGH95_005758, partial [Coemansia sp. RSA 1836]
GNAATLRYITIPFNVLVRDIIGAHHSFCTHSRCITIGKDTPDDVYEMAARGTRHIDQQLGQLAVSTRRLVLNPRNINRKNTLRVFQAWPGLDGLEHLELSNRPLTLRDVVNLVGFLPGLTSLSCQLCKALARADSLNAISLLNQLCYPLNGRLKSWATQSDAGMPVRHLAQGVMLITALCPSLCFVRVNPDIRAAFNREVAYAVLVTSFKKYAKRLQSILLDVGVAREDASDAE